MSYQWIHQTQIYRRLFNILIVIYSIHEEWIAGDLSNIVLLSILAKFSFDDNGIKTLSDVRQFVYPFVMHEVCKIGCKLNYGC